MCFGNYTVSYAFYFLFTDGKPVASEPSTVTHAFNPSTILISVITLRLRPR